MPYNLLFLPLLGGFIFVSRWNKTKYAARRADGHRLIFHAAIAGVILLFIAAFICAVMRNWFSFHSAFWQWIAPFPYSDVSALSLILGGTLWIVLNHLYPFSNFWREEDAISQAVKVKGDALEIMLHKAINETRPVMLTLNSNKVYLGVLLNRPNPAFPIESIKLLPGFSGYRKSATQEVSFTTDYMDIYLDIERGEQTLDGVTAEDFAIAFPMRDVTSVRFFDIEVYENYYATQNGTDSDETEITGRQ